jgi:hypothetical protein
MFVRVVLTCSDVIDKVHVLVYLEVLFDVGAGHPVLVTEVSGDGEALCILLTVDVQHRQLPERCS